jgi:hypothetical protein
MAPVFWTRKSALWAIDLIAMPGQAAAGSLHIPALDTVRRALIGRDGQEHIVLQRGDRALTMHARGSTLLSGPVAFQVLVDGLPGLWAAPNVLRRFHGLIAPTTSEPVSTRPWSQDYERLRDALIGLDSDLAGITYRNIAAVLFGDRAAAEDWGGSQSSLKQRVRRTINRGHELSNGGYRRLLHE